MWIEKRCFSLFAQNSTQIHPHPLPHPFPAGACDKWCNEEHHNTGCAKPPLGDLRERGDPQADIEEEDDE